jgi:hypothetical protein
MGLDPCVGRRVLPSNVGAKLSWGEIFHRASTRVFDSVGVETLRLSRGLASLLRERCWYGVVYTYTKRKKKRWKDE